MNKFILIGALFLGVCVFSASAEDKEMKVAFGGGISYFTYTNDQNVTVLEIKQNYSSFGFNAFADISKYFTVNVGYQVGTGKVAQDVSGVVTGSGSFTNNLKTWDLSAQLKYPFQFGGTTLSPKIGIDDVIYASGDVGGSTPSTDDGKQLVSPLLFTLGADIDFALGPNWFVRVPLDLGFGLNSKLSDAYYAGTTYSSSSILSFRTGIALGYTL